MLEINEKTATIKVINGDNQEEIIPFASARAFEIVSKYWLRVGWDTKHVYTFTWLGRPIIQLPEDLLRIQEVIFKLKPNIIIETGVAHGGSLVFYASILKALNIDGKIIGVDIDIRAHNKVALEAHEMASYIKLIEGSSTDPKVVQQVAACIPEQANNVVLVLLDSNHTKAHVAHELSLYSQFVTPGSYIVATDGIMKDLTAAPRANSDWSHNNPYQATQEFLATTDNFILEQPSWLFNESEGLKENVTYWPGAYLKRV